MIKINRDNNSIIPIEVDRHTVQGAGLASFHIHGTLHHLMGTLIPLDNHQPSYAQLYIYDPQEATNTHFQRNPDLQRDILLDLHQLLTKHHPYAPLYQQAYEVMRAKPPEQHTDVYMHLHFQQGDDGRRYNLPTVDEISAIVPGDGSKSVRVDIDIILCLQGGGLHHISNLHPPYLPLHYVLLFPNGQEGWHLDIPLRATGNRPHHSKKVTQILWYAYYLHIHPLRWTHLISSRLEGSFSSWSVMPALPLTNATFG